MAIRWRTPLGPPLNRRRGQIIFSLGAVAKKPAVP